MIDFLKSLAPKTRILLALITGGIVIFLFWVTLFGFLSARHSMEKVNQYNVAIGLANHTNADFQLAVSKAKNFAILKDGLNRDRTLVYFNQSKESFSRLSEMERDPKGQELLYRLGAALKSVEFSFGILLSTAHQSDPAESLYRKYLKDITIDFDKASQGYVDFLEEKIHSAQLQTSRETRLDLSLALAGALLGLVGMFLSFSIARNLNQALQNETASQQRYRTLSEVAEEAILLHDRGVIVEANATFARLLGYSLTEVLGKHVSLFMDAASNQVTQERIQRGYPEKAYELQAKRKDGSTFPLLVHGRDIEYQGRQLRLSCGWDMTEWKKTEKALRESQERFERFAEVTKEGIMIHEKGNIIDINQALLEMTGLKASELIGTDGLAALTEDSARTVRRFLESGFPLEPYEITLRRKDGFLFPVEVHGRPFTFEGRELRVARFWDITERKKAEQALRESEERFRSFAQIAKEGIFIHDDGLVVDANESLARMTGYPMEEIIGNKDFLFHKPTAKELIAKYKVEGYPKEPYEVIIRRKDGSLFPAEVEGRDFQWKGRKLRVVTLWDLAERKKAEEALRQSQERFERFAAVTKEGIYIHDKSVIVDANETLAQMVGYPVRELIGQREVFFGKAERAAQLEHFEKEGFPEAPYELEAFRKDGTSFPVEVHGRSFRIDGKLLRVVSIWDIRDRKKAEEALRRSEDRFRNMLENAYEGITLVDRAGKVIYISPANKKVTGYEPEERLGHSVLEIVHPDDIPKAQAVVEEVLANPGKPVTIQVHVRHKDGRWITGEYNLTNLLDNPAIGGVLINSRDITEKNQAEEALRHSEEHFRALIENSHDIIAVTGEDRAVTYMSPSVKRILGYDPSERIGQSFAPIMHPEDLPRMRAIFAEFVQQQGVPVTAEFRLLHKSGSWRQVESVGINFLKNPSIKGIIYNIRDITEKKEAEDALRQSEENFRNLIEKSPDAILVNDRNTIIYVNSKLISLLGYEAKEELLGKPAASIVHPDDQKTVVERIKTLSEGGRTYPMEIRLLRRDGVELPVEAASINIQSQGKPAIMVNLRDITARKQAEASARENQERYRSLVESMPDAVMIHDEEQVFFVNPSAVKLFGAAGPEEVLARPFWSVVPKEIQEVVRERVRRTIEHGIFNAPAERKLLRMDGAPLDVLVTSVPFYDRGRRVVLAILSDISARKEAERKAQRYQRLAVLGEMAAGLAHEIRNPAAAISAQAQYILKKTEQGDPSFDQLKDIIAQCDRLDTLVRDTLDYSPEKRFEERSEIAAKDLLEKALWLAQTQFGPSHARVQVRVEVGPDLPLLRVHPTRMERVLVNLILNAFQAMPEGGHLSLEAKRLGNKAVLRVGDDGKGISDKDMSRLFEPFFTSRKMGSGLGLSICQKIVEEHGGHIRVEKAQPQGAVFIIEIPLGNA